MKNLSAKRCPLPGNVSQQDGDGDVNRAPSRDGAEKGQGSTVSLPNEKDTWVNSIVLEITRGRNEVKSRRNYVKLCIFTLSWCLLIWRFVHLLVPWSKLLFNLKLTKNIVSIILHCIVRSAFATFKGTGSSSVRQWSKHHWSCKRTIEIKTTFTFPNMWSLNLILQVRSVPHICKKICKVLTAFILSRLYWF